MVAALIGGLAGFGAGGPFGAITGAVSGALVGIATDYIEQDIHLNVLKTVAHEIGSNTTVLIAEVSPADIGSFEALIHHCEGTMLHSTISQPALSLPAR